MIFLSRQVNAIKKFYVPTVFQGGHIIVVEDVDVDEISERIILHLHQPGKADTGGHWRTLHRSHTDEVFTTVLYVKSSLTASSRIST